MKNKVVGIIFIIILFLSIVSMKYGYDTMYTVNGVEAEVGPPYFYGGIIGVIVGIIATVLNIGKNKNDKLTAGPFIGLVISVGLIVFSLGKNADLSFSTLPSLIFAISIFFSIIFSIVIIGKIKNKLSRN